MSFGIPKIPFTYPVFSVAIPKFKKQPSKIKGYKANFKKVRKTGEEDNGVNFPCLLHQFIELILQKDYLLFDLRKKKNPPPTTITPTTT